VFCFRAQKEELSVGILNMGRPRKDAPPVSSKNKTTGVMMNGKKIDRRKKEFRNLPKSKTKKQKRYGPPSHILKATIAPKFKEMREQHQSYNNNNTNNSSRGVMFNNGGGGGLGGKEEEECNNNNAKKCNEEENEDGEEEAWRECDVVGKKENTSNEGGRAGTPTPPPTTLTTTTNTHATGGGGGGGGGDGGGGGETTTTITTTTKSDDANKEDAATTNAMMMSLQQKRKREALRKEEEEIERREKDDAKWRPVCLSRPTMAKGIELMDDGRMVASSQKGYRCVQGTRGVEPVVVCEEEEKEEGMKEDDETKETTTTTTARYFEVKIEHLGGSGCVRVGWMTKRGEMNAPVGFDNKGYGYHAETGSKYHEARLKTYGEPYGEGDVVGCYLYLDEKIVEKKEQVDAQETSGGGDDDGIKNEEAKKKQTPSTPERNKKNRKGEERLKAKAFEENQNSPNEGKIVFYKNGKCQGIAFESLRSCVHPKKPLELSGYFPTAALYTTPLQDQSQRARVSFNFGPDFAFPIDPEKDVLPKCSGFSPDLDPPKPPEPLVPEKIEDGGTHVPALGSVENAVVKLEETEQKEEEEEEKEGDNEKVNSCASEEAKEQKEAPMMEVKQEEEDEGKETEKEKEEEEVREFVKLSAAVEPASFFRGGEDAPGPARGLDAYVVEASASPIQKEEEDVEEKEEEPPEAAETAPTGDDDNQHFFENIDVETNKSDDGGNIGYDWLSG